MLYPDEEFVYQVNFSLFDFESLLIVTGKERECSEILPLRGGGSSIPKS